MAARMRRAFSISSGAGAEDLVGERDLVWVDHPLALEPENRGPHRGGAKSGLVAKIGVGAVDRPQAVGARGDGEARQRGSATCRSSGQRARRLGSASVRTA